MRPASAGDGVGAEARYLSSGPTLCASDEVARRDASDDERAERRRCDVRCDVRIARGGASKQERPLWRRVRRRSTKNCNQTGVQSLANTYSVTCRAQTLPQPRLPSASSSRQCLDASRPRSTLGQQLAQLRWCAEAQSPTTRPACHQRAAGEVGTADAPRPARSR